MRTRHLCAILGVAIAVGSVAFMQSLVATNDHQATAVAERLLTEVPVDSEAQTCSFALDYRPNGRVMQGPPMLAVVCGEPRAALSPFHPFTLSPSNHQCIVTRALFAQRRLPVPPLGTELVLIGRTAVHRLTLAGVIEWSRPVRGYPNVFVSAETAADIAERWEPWRARSVDELAPAFMSDAARHFDRAKALLLWAAALTALCLLVNSLFLSVESSRREIAVRRMIGMTRGGVAAMVVKESVLLTAIGLVVGLTGGVAALAVYVALDPATYPMGPAVAWTPIGLCAAIAPLVAGVAALLALKPALSVRPLELASNRLPRKKQLGMLMGFACGFGAFVAVEVWGASLMCAFVPSPEWPDAIVSILPGGVSSFDIAKLRDKIEGVRRIHELAPLQVNLLPLEELKGFGGGRGGPGRGGRGKAYRNALLLGSDWLPEFAFVAGTREEAVKQIAEGDNCIITEMMARARKLKLGDDLLLDCGRGLEMPLKIVGIVDLNWHMVTSRGLVRGLNRMPVNTDGPVFVSFDTVEACDMRPAPMVKMTHLWLDYDPAFARQYGVFEAGRRVEKSIVRALGLLETEVDDNTVRLHARDEIADGTLAHGVDLIGAMARVPFIFIAVISLGFVAMLVASVESRRREFRVLRAVGATRGQLCGVLVKEALKVAVWGVVIGCVGGALVGWLCTSGTRAAMANWGIPPSFALPYLTIVKGAAGAVLFALLVAVPTSLTLSRENMI